jgi:5'-phosphate synthase pdxT subunit
MKIGILALQGAFKEHMNIFVRLGVDVCQVKLAEDLDELDGLVIPGGESTTIGKLSVRYDLVTPLRHFAEHRSVWGICAGMILMAKRIEADQPWLGFMDMAVSRNAFGRQVDSFETGLTIKGIDGEKSFSFPAVFIRAPKVVDIWGDASIIARLDRHTAVAVRQQKHLATAFHPELTDDPRMHQYFLRLTQS